MHTIKTLSLGISLALALPYAAHAHAFLDSASPKVGSVVKEAPSTIDIYFTQSVEAAFSHIQLIAPDGAKIAVGMATTNPKDPTELSVPITGALSPGRYEVQWDVVSVDTHRTNGHFPFLFQP